MNYTTHEPVSMTGFMHCFGSNQLLDFGLVLFIVLSAILGNNQMFLILSACIFNFQIFVCSRTWISIGSVFCFKSAYAFSCTCPSRIYVSEAIYGRTTDRNICPHSANKSTHCRSTTSDRKVKALCNGKRICRLQAENRTYGDPCNCSFTSITINWSNGMQFHGPSTETTGD
jgi:hypothetical protein